MFCHSCGKEIREDSKFCNSCGSKIIIDEKVKEVNNDIYNCCPKCKSKNVQKFEVIYLQETKSFNSTGVNINNESEIGLSANSGSISSLLSAKVKKPNKQDKTGILFLFNIIIYYFMFLITLFATGNAFDDISITSLLFLFLVLIGDVTVIFAMRKWMKQVKDKDKYYNENIYPVLLKEWGGGEWKK